jgi:hypothetical protein
VDHQHFEIPKLRALAKHALPHLVEGTIVPLALFYGFLWIVGVWGAIIAAMVWSYSALARRLLTRQRVPGLLILGAVGMTARTLVAFISHSSFVYFLQPSLATALVGGAFLFTVRSDRPLAQRLAHDFVPLPAWLLGRPHIRRVFVRITLLWAMVNLVNAAVAVVLLVSEPLATYLAAKTFSTWIVTGSGVAVSAWLFKRTIRQHGVSVTPAAIAGS